jgi:hypothetical protein
VGAALSRGAPPGADWLPGWAGWRDGAFCVEWCHFGGHRLKEPFFGDSLTRVMRRPVNQLLRHRTPVEALEARVARQPGLPPRGFVLHTSRCGSKLVAQLLAATRGSVVLSEAPPIDAVLGAVATPDGSAVPEERRARWLAWMLGALGAPRQPDDDRLFVKFDAWHTLELPLLRRVFPGVPWVFLYRDPREVLASQLRQPGGFLVPGVLEAGGRLGGLRLDGDTVAERIATLLADTCAAALAALPSGGGLLVNYAELPTAFEDVIAPHFRLELDAADRAALAEVARMDAKSPGAGWTKPEAREVTLGTVELDLLEERVMPVYRELERCRKNIQSRAPGTAAARVTR